MGVCACSKRCSLVLAEMFIEMSVIQLLQEVLNIILYID